ncbi:MAG: SPOR domain-containing protein [Tumebacillaceae bacterium]
MDKPQMAQHQEPSALLSSSFRAKVTKARNMKLLAPLLLAIVTGVLLGVCLLLLFRGQVGQPTVTTVQSTPAPTNPANGNQVKGTAKLSGTNLWTWQLASFQEQAPAQKAAQEFATKGIHTTTRQVGTTYQLLVGVGTDKKSGAALEAALKDMKIDYYAKAYAIEARTGSISGLSTQDAKTLTDGLGKEIKLATDALLVAQQTTPDTKAVVGLKQQFDALQAAEKNWHNMLVQAGLNGEAAALDNTHKQLADAIATMQTPGNLLGVQAKLTAFFVDYEALSGQLVKSE